MSMDEVLSSTRHTCEAVHSRNLLASGDSGFNDGSFCIKPIRVAEGSLVQGPKDIIREFDSCKKGLI